MKKNIYFINSDYTSDLLFGCNAGDLKEIEFNLT